ncbi:gamma-glutamyl-gamma-aminobutyrate hydrolase family protein [Chitinimonas koreensis]|uniref:gamma-glutamyl-gamma-aminobutyrate hydrolase family protein n=1 Tax=Chitinimonas koreensis TaxID=356302 RepID=UPI00048A570A|nr:gamma-glutamyl-gamma-aminobutyrate hydrolase family protein [Chitinimonas koreensis]QNM95743.1 gamma-glutamyl-gamma-aminobutyrate hydrolase family protein [Chitinimonas koreensis]
MKRKPLVALVADRKMLGHHPFHCVGEKYIDAVVDGAGCLAMLIPALGERQDFDSLLELVDGFMFTGSVSMVDPRRYSGPELPEGQFLDTARDETAMPLMKAAVARGIPVFAICRGFQEMNVVFGGTLHQKVHETPGMMDHREDAAADLAVQYGPAHPVSFTADGLIHRISGMKEARVNSIHNQGVQRLGEGLRAEAVAPDGLIEAFSVRDAQGFTLAVQWHPEWKYADNPLSVKLFKAFGDDCRRHLASRS